MKPIEIIFGLIRIPIDYLITIGSFMLAYYLRSTTDLIPGVQLPVTISEFPTFQEHLLFSSIVAAVLIAIMAASGLFQLKQQLKLSKQFSRILVSTTIWLFVIISYYFIIRAFPYSRLALFHTWWMTILLISLAHWILHLIQQKMYISGKIQTRVLLVGINKITEDFANLYFKNPQLKCVGYLNNTEHDIPKIKYLGTLANLEETIKKRRIEKIIQISSKLSESQETNLLDFCREHHLDYSFIPDQLELQRSNIEIETFNGIPMINLKPTPLDGWGRVVKRLFDLIASLFLLVALSPIMLIVAIAIKIEDPKSPILFIKNPDGARVKRVGQKGKLFHFFKFRSMIPNAHSLRDKYAQQNTRKDSPLVKIKNDPRITMVGKFIRKTSLDELPQLWSVLKGDMSLVGPRPHLPEEVAKYQKHHKFVLTIKPGITGLAQISGRSDLDFETEVKLDTYYIENWSLWLDIKILFQTIFVVFKKYEE